jgi:hypothetical protein
MRGMCISVFCLMGEGQMYKMKCDLDTHLSSPKDLKDRVENR